MFISGDHDLQVLLAVSTFSAVMSVFLTSWVTSRTLARLFVVTRSIRDPAEGNRGSDEYAAPTKSPRWRRTNTLARQLAEARAECWSRSMSSGEN
ncbi:MAG: hypothetical protein IPH65_17445 [Dehalococcoidia bacterium]|uniref:hypothetical protein n=1 Tax=Candidatus Amarobacter glycogenicus TaxID=3140699 RepID=UPI0031371DBA|nr:hypothetical protein [Dehalococcoidia bacterium]